MFGKRILITDHDHRPAGERQIGCEIAQRAQHELALVRTRMRQRQMGVGTDRVLVPDQVEVERARSPAHVPDAPVRRLDREEDVE